MKPQHFNIVYDGDALVYHLMDVRDLAPALIALSDLVADANKELNGDKADVNLQVRASFKAGSFGIDMVLVQHILSQMRDFFAGDTVSALCNAMDLLEKLGLAASGIGLIQLIKFLRGRKPERILHADKKSTIIVSEEEFLEVDNDVLRLYRNKKVILDLEKVLEPLRQNGIDEFGVVIDGVAKELVNSDEVDFFKVNSDAETLQHNVQTKYLQIENVSFKENTKWKFSDGGAVFFADILDKDFLANVDNGERFGKGDVLKVDLAVEQTMQNGKLLAKYTIVKVLEHIEVPKQQGLL